MLSCVTAIARNKNPSISELTAGVQGLYNRKCHGSTCGTYSPFLCSIFFYLIKSRVTPNKLHTPACLVYTRKRCDTFFGRWFHCVFLLRCCCCCFCSTYTCFIHLCFFHSDKKGCVRERSLYQHQASTVVFVAVVFLSLLSSNVILAFKKESLLLRLRLVACSVEREAIKKA
jgi:hypothetical protein